MQGPIENGWDTLFINLKNLVQVNIVMMQASCKVTMGHSSLVITTNEQII